MTEGMPRDAKLMKSRIARPRIWVRETAHDNSNPMHVTITALPAATRKVLRVASQNSGWNSRLAYAAKFSFDNAARLVMSVAYRLVSNRTRTGNTTAKLT